MNEEKKLRLTVASSPHVASPIDTTNLMRDVLIALVPTMVMGVVFFGPRALVATIISVLACEFFEWGYRKLMHKSCAVKDLSAAVTGVLLAFVCAPTLPYWMLIIGDFFAIVVVKQLFGGLGKNFMNPALGGNDRLVWMTYQLFTGGLFLGAFFMATDYVTSPVTKKGEIIFGIGCGLLTVFIRKFGGYPEGVSYAILIMNTCVWLLDKVGKPARFGVTKEMKEKQKAAKKAAKEAEAK